MEVISVREFKANVSRLIRDKKSVLVMKNSAPVGFFVPWDAAEADGHFRAAALSTLMRAMERDRLEKGVTEEEVMADFEQFRKSRGGRKRDTLGGDRG